MRPSLQRSLWGIRDNNEVRVRALRKGTQAHPQALIPALTLPRGHRVPRLWVQLNILAVADFDSCPRQTRLALPYIGFIVIVGKIMYSFFYFYYLFVRIFVPRIQIMIFLFSFPFTLLFRKYFTKLKSMLWWFPRFGHVGSDLSHSTRLWSYLLRLN